MLQQSTLSFLKDLKKNNNKPWFEANRNKFEQAKTDWETLVQQVLDKMAKVDGL